MKNIGSCRFISLTNRIPARLFLEAADSESSVGLRVDMGSGVASGSFITGSWPRDILLLLFVYSKSEQDDLIPEQLRKLKKVIKGEYR